MFTLSDIPHLREQILANAAFLHREKSTSNTLQQAFTRSEKLEIIVHNGGTEREYVAALVDLSTGDVVLQSDKAGDPALAMHKLFDQTADIISKDFAARNKEAGLDNEGKPMPTHEKK